MADVIPGINYPEDTEPATWQDYLEEAVKVYTQEDNSDTSPLVVYTDAAYIDAVLDDFDSQFSSLLGLFPGLDAMTPEEMDQVLQIFRESMPDWDAACGTSEGPGDGNDGQQPATVNLDVPDGGVAGQPITLSATVLDDNGDPVAGQQVTFTIEEEEDPAAGTLRAAALTLDRAGDGPTILTGTTDTNGVATVAYTPTASGTLRVTASTGGDNPVSTGPAATIPVTTAPGDGGGNDNDDDDDNTDGGGNQSGSGALGSLFGSLGSSGS